MNLQERIADWISGGALSALIADLASLQAALRDEIDLSECRDAVAREATFKAYQMREQLNRIAACETPSANATVRRMAQIARERDE